MTLPSHPPPYPRGTRIMPRVSNSAANASCWKLHAKRYALYYAVLILVLFFWSGSFLRLHLLDTEMDDHTLSASSSSTARRSHRNRHPSGAIRTKQRSSKQQLNSKLPLWNPRQHPSPDVPLTGTFRYRNTNNPDACTNNNNHNQPLPLCGDGRLFFPAVDLKSALPHDEAADMLATRTRGGIASQTNNHNNDTTTAATSVTKKLVKRQSNNAFFNQAVLTRGGNKAMAGVGSVTSNQDRILLLDQFSSTTTPAHHDDFVMALFDGHGTQGHAVSHYAAITLLPLLSKHLQERKSNAKATTKTLANTPQQALTKTFLELDKSLPIQQADDAGSTAIVMLRLDNALYIANAGDSCAFVASYDPKTETVGIVYKTQPHKPNVPEERARIEEAGGQVVDAQGPGDSSRVIIPMGNTMVMALAMSRSIGDKQGKAVGVIANPTVDELDLNKLMGTVSSGNAGKEFFVVAASDGLVDRVPEQEVAETLAKSFFEKTTVSPLEACEQLIMKSSQGWIANGVPYRDDISVATTILARKY